MTVYITTEAEVITEKTALCSTQSQAEKQLEKLGKKLCDYYLKKSLSWTILTTRIEIVYDTKLATDAIRASVLEHPEFLNNMLNVRWNDGDLFYDVSDFQGVIEYIES